MRVRPLWVTRLLIVFVAVPLILLLMVLDAVAAAWDEFSEDFRSAKSALADNWRNGDEQA